jgi:hypothetical protein
MERKKTKKSKTEDETKTNEEDEIKNPELEEIQERIEKFLQEGQDKALEVIRDYNKRAYPLYKERNQIISKIPNFWHKAFSNNPNLFLTEEDQKVLEHLKEIDVIEDLDDSKHGYKITFTFGSNPYFENDILWKEIRPEESGSIKVSASKINWKEGKDITKVPEEPKGGKKRKKAFDESFFTWFSEENDNGEIGDIIREHIWSDPAHAYYGIEDDDDEFDIDEEDDEELDGEHDEGEEGDEGQEE